MSMIHHGMCGHPSDNYYACEICTLPKIRELESQLSQVQGELKQYEVSFDRAVAQRVARRK